MGVVPHRLHPDGEIKRPSSGPRMPYDFPSIFLAVHLAPYKSLVCTTSLPHSSDHSPAPIPSVPPLSCWHPRSKVLRKLLLPTLSSSTPSPSVNTLYASGWSPVNRPRRGCARAPTRSTMVLPKPYRRLATCYQRVARRLRACRVKAQH